MDALLDDITNERNTALLKRLRGTIIDSAKNIKSNDAAFKISTLPKVTDRITKIMDNYIQLVQQVSASQAAFLKLNEDMERREQETDADEIIELEIYSNQFEELIEKERDNYKTLEAEAIPDLNKIILPNEDEIQFEENPANRQIPKDPITKKNIKVAVKSRICNHIYDQEGIEEYFKQKELARKTKIQCPVAGCTNRKMTRNDIVLDEETNRIIQSLTSNNNQ